MENTIFRTMDRSGDVADSKRCYSYKHYLRDMNDAKKSAAFESMKVEADIEGMSVRRLYERNDWAEFVPTVFMDAVLENTSYQSTASQLATTVTVPSGLTYVYREFENFQRAQRGGENTEFERKKGTRRTQETALHTLGARSYVTEEEILDIPIDSMRLELNAMGASLALERDNLWMDSLYRATSGTNADTFGNELTAKSTLDVEGLHAVLTWFASPFATETTTIDLTNPFATGKEATKVEGLMRNGKFRASDVLVSPKQYWSIVNNEDLKKSYIWANSRILDTGELQVPLLGVNIWKTNVGYYTDVNDADSWVATDDVIICDRRMGGTGTIGTRQPLQVRQWEMPSFRTQDFQIFERVGFAVQNRRALIRVTQG